MKSEKWNWGIRSNRRGSEGILSLEFNSLSSVWSEAANGKERRKRGGSLNWFFPFFELLNTSAERFLPLQFIGFPDELFSLCCFQFHSVKDWSRLYASMEMEKCSRLFSNWNLHKFQVNRVFCVFSGQWARFSTFCISVSTQLFIFDSIKIKFTRQLLCSSLTACTYFPTNIRTCPMIWVSINNINSKRYELFWKTHMKQQLPYISSIPPCSSNKDSLKNSWKVR